MASIRSNLNSVSSTTNFAAIKNRLNTCIENWRSKTSSTQQHHTEYFYWQKKRHEKLYFYKYIREYSLKEKTSEHLKQFKNKIKKLFSSKKGAKGSSNKPEKTFVSKEKVQIVAKLVSTSFIATSSSAYHKNIFEAENKKCGESFEERFLRSLKMTIVDDSVLTIREEFPEIETEVRGILMARSQDGATIAEIREDYYKNTGMPFPILENVTEFLLSIPYVSAICDENGTRIFNIKPSEKNKHIHNLIINQKSMTNNPFKKPFEKPQSQGSSCWRKNMSKYKRPRTSDISSDTYYYSDSNYYYANEYQKYLNLFEREKENNFVAPNNEDCNNNNVTKERTVMSERAKIAKEIELFQEHPTEQNHIEDQESEFSAKPLPRNAEIFSNKDIYTDELIENNEIHQDNWNYFYSRLYNLGPPGYYFQNIYDQNFNNDNFCNMKSGLFYPNANNFYKQHQQQAQAPPSSKADSNIYNNLNTRRRQATPFYHVISSRSTSSPTFTRSSEANESIFTIDSDYDAHYLDFPLLGDDFFLYMARMELKCKFRKNHRILQSGFCVSGQTIRRATDRIHLMPHHTGRKVIVNIGSVDIMKGRPLVKIENDLKKLLHAMREKGLVPILTTLAPLANYAHDPLIKATLDRFNDFIKRQSKKYTVVDIHSCLVNELGQTRFDCYQNGPRKVTGTEESYVFWNKIGRQRVLKLIESKLEY